MNCAEFLLSLFVVNTDIYLFIYFNFIIWMYTTLAFSCDSATEYFCWNIALAGNTAV